MCEVVPTAFEQARSLSCSSFCNSVDHSFEDSIAITTRLASACVNAFPIGATPCPAKMPRQTPTPPCHSIALLGRDAVHPPTMSVPLLPSLVCSNVTITHSSHHDRPGHHPLHKLNRTWPQETSNKISLRSGLRFSFARCIQASITEPNSETLPDQVYQRRVYLSSL
jgi:hypothetical protein